jgi:hypothetical protein
MTKHSIGTARRSMAATAVVLVSLAGAGLAGCGGSNDKSDTKADPNAGSEASIRKVITQLQEASVAGDGKQICTQIFTPKLADSVTKSATSGSCAKEVRQNLFSPKTRIDVQDVNVTDAANATATVKEASGNVSTLFFVRQSGRWRIRSVQPA